ncbi:LamG-like jellyroll fold domain-containing protein [Paraglaciecola aquimarina]|uniref:LamG-like jellyroll fold domain-containing protein n=1 Tax=Paraglaciecola aquimarina TaxID=1235557 RepID=A0ABU3SZ60_9ALTE|nr:LamG-like jellyroll fold domain-containing protein [Paraglaciecola aquimarina]MDU0355299.1 LamG-like jellyroll fold domain-containing protein [Paraglaciecola aquimarina]
MTKQEQQLIAAYLAGEKVERELWLACENNQNLHKHLAKLKIVDRLIASQHKQMSDEQFVTSITQLLKKPNQNTWWGNLTAGFAQCLHLVQFRPVLLSVGLCALLLMSYHSFYLPNVTLAKVDKVTGISLDSRYLQVNDQLKSGLISLQQGYAELSLINGVTLVLEAPIILDLKSADHVVLQSGNLVAKVPEQAIGFKVDTPSSQIIDLGTEFAVSVQNSGESQVHVLEGEIKVRATKQQSFEHVFINQARAFDLNEQVSIIQNNPKMFMRALPGKSLTDPEYMHWSFDELTENGYLCDGQGINNQCFNAHPKSMNANQTGPETSNGQFGDALYFNGEDAWLETDFPGIGEDKPRTVAFWVKVPKDFSVNNAYGILGWGLSYQSSAWQISPNPQQEDGPLGRIRVGTNDAQVIGTTDIRDSRWHHVSIVLFGGEQVNLSTHVLIYIDGKLEKSSNKSIAKVFTQLQHPKSKPLILGRNIGYEANQINKERKFFRGWIDEVFIFDSALNQNQIVSLIENNAL